MSFFCKSDFIHLNRFLNDRRLIIVQKKHSFEFQKLNNSDGSIKYNNSLSESPPKKKGQIPLVCLSLKKEKNNEKKNVLDSQKEHKQYQEKFNNNNNDKNLVKTPIMVVDLFLDEKKVQIEVYPKETAFDVVRRIANEKKLELFLENIDENAKKKKMKILAEILQKHINDYIQELSDYIEKERKQKFKVFKAKSQFKEIKK